MEDLKAHLTSLGADNVFTYSELADRSTFPAKLAAIMQSNPLRLALNCVSGPDTTNMVRYLSPDAHLVTYGGMSKQPVSIPSGSFIFRNLRAVGFGVSRWYRDNSDEARQLMLEHLVEMFNSGQLRPPRAKVSKLSASNISEDELGALARAMAERTLRGRTGEKQILQWDE